MIAISKQDAVCHCHVYLRYFSPNKKGGEKVAKDSYSYYVTFVWSCNVALWDISLHFVE